MTLREELMEMSSRLDKSGNPQPENAPPDPYADGYRFGQANAADDLRAILDHIATVERERDKAQSDYEWMVKRAADQHLDGYRELGARAAAAERQRDDWKFRHGLQLEERDHATRTAQAYMFHLTAISQALSDHWEADELPTLEQLPVAVAALAGEYRTAISQRNSADRCSDRLEAEAKTLLVASRRLLRAVRDSVLGPSAAVEAEALAALLDGGDTP